MVGAVNIDLAAQSFVSGAISVEIQNFVDVKGTTNNDTIKGDAGDNVFFGSAGSDVYDGREGAGDTINYTGLGGAVTLKALGGVEKSTGGTDTIENMEKIVGDAGKANAIDGTVTVPSNGTVPVGGTVSFDINLGTNILKLIGLGPTPVPFTVENFVNVIGTSNNDTIVGSEAANDIKGAEGADTIDGGGGADTLWGNEGADRLIGGEGADSLRGGGGTDTFVFSLFSKEVDKVIDFFSIESVVLEGAGFFGFNGEIFTGSRLDSMVGVSQNKGGHVLMVTENGSLLSLEFDGTLFAQLTTDGFNLMT